MNLLSLLARPVHSADSAVTGLASRLPSAKGGDKVEYWWNRIITAGDAEGPRLREPYRWSPWVQRAVKIKSNEISSATLRFMQAEAEFEEPDFLAYWKAPAIGPNGQRIPIAEVYEMLTGWLDLKGIYYLILDDEFLVPFPSAKTFPPLIIARPDRMKRIFSGKRLIGYEFTDAAGVGHALLPEQVIVNKFWNPYDDYEGLAPLDSVMNAAEGDYLAGLYVRNLMRNNGDQGVYVINEDGLPTDEQREQIVQALREKKAAAAAGSFKPVFLGGKIKIEDAKAQAPDAAFNETRIQSRHEIFIGLGVPPSMADVVASYSIGSASDRYQLIESTCIPLGIKLCGPFSVIASKMTGRPLEAMLDWDEHRVMQEVRIQRIDSATKLWDRGMPWETINEYLDLGMPDFEGWDTGYLPFSVVPTDDMLNPPDPIVPQVPEGEATPADNNVPPDETGKALLNLKALFSRAQKFIQARREQNQTPDKFVVLATTKRSAHEVAQWRTHMAKRRVGEKRTHAAVTKNLMAARSEVLRNIERLVPVTPTDAEKSTMSQSLLLQPFQKSGGLIFDLNFNKEHFTGSLLGDLNKAAKQNMFEAGQQLFLEIGNDDPFTIPDPQVLLQLKKRTNLLRDVPDEMYKTVQNALVKGLEEGEGRGELSNRVRGVFNDMNRGRANTIAQTETASAYGFGRKHGMTESGVGFQQWLSSADDKVREEHAEANGQVVEVDEPFDVDGEELMYPGDSDGGSAGNVINCRCVAIPVLDEDGQKALKARREAKRVAK